MTRDRPVARKNAGSLVANKTHIFEDENCYIYQRADTETRNWQFYYWDANGGKGFRIRRSLKTKSFTNAIALAKTEYIRLQGKIAEKQSLQPLTVSEMAAAFLEKKRAQISDMPHAGVTKETYRVLKNRCEKLIEYLGKDTKVDELERNVFQNYEQWRMEGNGGKVPQTKTSIKTELSTFRSIIQTIAIKDKRVISHPPDVPDIRTPRNESEHRRNHFRDEELEIFLRTLDEWKEERLNRSTAEVHRRIVAIAIEVMLNSGIRIGAAKKIRWRDVRINSVDTPEKRTHFRIITVPPENNKTGKEYQCNCRVALPLKLLENLSRYTKKSDFLFCNQADGKPFSERIWADSWKEIMRRTRLEEESDRKFSYYSLRHTYATLMVKNNVNHMQLAANMNTSVKYIESHYYHHIPEQLTDELNPASKKRTSTADDMLI